MGLVLGLSSGESVSCWIMSSRISNGSGAEIGKASFGASIPSVFSTVERNKNNSLKDIEYNCESIARPSGRESSRDSGADSRALTTFNKVMMASWEHGDDCFVSSRLCSLF